MIQPMRTIDPEISYFDRSGNPIDYEAWSVLIECPEYRIVAEDELEDGSLLTTLWLGLNHTIFVGERIIFETRHLPSNIQQRYSTEEEALEGHAKLREEFRD